MAVLLKDKRLIIAVVTVVVIILIGMLSGVIAHDEGLIPFGPDQVSKEAIPYSVPGTSEMSDGGSLRKHILGTDQLGRDVMSRLIHGISIAMKVGILSSMISLIIALLLGGLSGYLGDRTHKMNLLQLFLLILGALLIYYYASELAFFENDRGEYVKSYTTYGIILGLGLLVLTYISRLNLISGLKEFWVPWDTIVVKLLEVFRSIPRLFLLLAIFSIITVPSVASVIWVIGFIRWPNLTRIIRAEIMAQKQDNYVKNAEILGLSSMTIFLRHVLPNVYRPIIVLTALNMGTAILIESSLSFLHIGLPIGEVSWGRMLSDARQYIPAWWLAIGPGILIFITILCFNTIGDRLSYHFKVNKQGL